MIAITDDTATITFPWPTNDTGQGILKMMTNQASSALAAEGVGRRVRGGIRFDDIRRTETGFEFVFSAKLRPQEETDG